MNLTKSKAEPRPRRHVPNPPRRTAPYEDEPGFYVPGNVWMHGNTRLLLADLAYVEECCAPVESHTSWVLQAIEKEAEKLVLSHRILVCGIHNDAHRRAAVVPLRWGSPRVVIVSGGFHHHLGKDLREEPFRIARLWRYKWDAMTDLIISFRAPDRLPTYANQNPTVDRLIAGVACRTARGFCDQYDPFGPRVR